MKPPDYDKIPTWFEFRMQKVAVPGVYCRGCGRTFALYAWSVIQPEGLDENNKPYYNTCFFCPEHANDPSNPVNICKSFMEDTH